MRLMKTPGEQQKCVCGHGGTGGLAKEGWLTLTHTQRTTGWAVNIKKAAPHLSYIAHQPGNYLAGEEVKG